MKVCPAKAGAFSENKLTRVEARTLELGEKGGGRPNPESLSTKPSLGWSASHWAATKVNAELAPKRFFTPEAEPSFMRRRQHGTWQTGRHGGTLWRGWSGSTMTRMCSATGETLLAPVEKS